MLQQFQLPVTWLATLSQLVTPHATKTGKPWGKKRFVPALLKESIVHTMEKPLLDDRSYRVIQLPNQLEILLIHDPNTDKAAAAMDVNVGSFSDPDDLPGTAHAVEHFCFMGTKKVSDRYADILETR